MFYLRLTLMTLFFIFGSILSMIECLFHWADPRYFYRGANFVGKGVMKLSGFKVIVENRENLYRDEPFVILINHQSALDVAILGSIAPPRAVPIAKKELFKVPLVGWWLKGTGVLAIDRQNRTKAVGQLDFAIEEMFEKNLAITIAPEGTRNRAGKGLLPFKKGPFYLAIKAQAPLLPLVVEELGDRANFEKRTLKGGPLKVRIMQTIPTKGLTSNDVESLMNKTRELMLQNLAEVSKA